MIARRKSRGALNLLLIAVKEDRTELFSGLSYPPLKWWGRSIHDKIADNTILVNSWIV